MKKITTTSILAASLFIFSASVGQDTNIERINSYDKYGYVQAVRVGNTLYLSGITGQGAMDQSLQSVYTRIEKALNEAGADFSSVVKENLYTTDIDAVKANNAVRLKFYNGKYPAATWVQVDRLFMPDYNLEVEVIAILQK
jgi:enamine deaminase RidA (YjgF/YER057c/UK114 family)